MVEERAPSAADGPNHEPVVRAAAVIWRDGRLLLLQRPSGGAEPPTWELPTECVGAWETAGAALARGIEQVLGVTARVGELLEIERARGRAAEVHYIRCELESFEFRPGAASQTWRWVRPPDIGLQEVAPFLRAFVARLASG